MTFLDQFGDVGIDLGEIKPDAEGKQNQEPAD